MSNMLTEYQQELRTWEDKDLAYAVEHLNNRANGSRLYSSQQKKDIIAEVAKRLRWGRKAEDNQFHTYAVEAILYVEATNEDEAHDGAEIVLTAAQSREQEIGINFPRFTLGSTTLEDL